MSYVKEMFGKKFKDLTKKERAMYHNAIQGLDLRSKSKCRQKFGKGYNELTKQEKCKCYYTKQENYQNSIAYKIFNKRYKDLSKEEINQFRKTEDFYVKKLKNSYKESFCFNYFGKRHSELTKEENQEFNRIMKQRSRERTGRN